MKDPKGFNFVGVTGDILDSLANAKTYQRISPPPVIKEARKIVDNGKYQHILSPLKLNDKYTMKNRVMCSPMVFGTAVVGNEYGNAAYAAGKYSKLEMPAIGGTAMVSVGETDVNSKEGKRMPLPDVDFSIRSGEAFNAISEYAWRIKRNGAIALIELSHPGISKPPIPGTEIWGPVAGDSNGHPIIPFDEEMMESVCNDFKTVTLFLKQAGFDGVCVHAGHGFLFTQFLSPLTNTRTDEYGGSIENRSRFPLRILKGIREVTDPDFIIEMRISGREGVPGGMEIEETIQFLKMCEGIITAAHISTGLYNGRSERSSGMSSVFEAPAYTADMAKLAHAAVKYPIGMVGKLIDPDLIEKLLADGVCDYVVMGRQLIADPEFVHKLEEGREKEIRKCVGCVSCFEFPDPEQEIPFDGVMPWLKVGNCSINPIANMEKTLDELPQPAAARKVVVVGGGPGGMQAAITAADRGHQVILMEAKERLGGILHFAEVDVHKHALAEFMETLIYEVSLRDIEVRLNTVANAELLAAEHPDAVILAIGSETKTPPIPGLKNAIPALEVYTPGTVIGKKVVMVGGGLVGSETGLHLACLGHDVTIVEPLKRIAHESCGIYRFHFMIHINKNGVKYLVKTACKEIRPDGVVITGEDGQESFLPADTIVYALGYNPKDTTELEKAVPGAKVYKLGDCSKPGKIGGAVKEGFNAAMDIL